MSGTSKVGGPGVYEAGDERNAPQSEVNQAVRYKEGQPGSHKALDSSKLQIAQISTLHLHSAMR